MCCTSSLTHPSHFFSSPKLFSLVFASFFYFIRNFFFILLFISCITTALNDINEVTREYSICWGILRSEQLYDASDVVKYPTTSFLNQAKQIQVFYQFLFWTYSGFFLFLSLTLALPEPSFMFPALAVIVCHFDPAPFFSSLSRSKLI
jgi:hypothetical protein